MALQLLSDEQQLQRGEEQKARLLAEEREVLRQTALVFDELEEAERELDRARASVSCLVDKMEPDRAQAILEQTHWKQLHAYHVKRKDDLLHHTVKEQAEYEAEVEELRSMLKEGRAAIPSEDVVQAHSARGCEWDRQCVQLQALRDFLLGKVSREVLEDIWDFQSGTSPLEESLSTAGLHQAKQAAFSELQETHEKEMESLRQLHATATQEQSLRSAALSQGVVEKVLQEGAGSCPSEFRAILPDLLAGVEASLLARLQSP